MKLLIELPKQFILLLISLYQHTLSPDHGIFRGRYPHGYCRHFPSCSQFAKEAVLKFGVIKGSWFSARRILRCNPWVEPSIDKP